MLAAMSSTRRRAKCWPRPTRRSRRRSIKKLRKADVTKVQVFAPSGRVESALIKNTLAKDPTHSEEEALKQIYSLLRPGDAPNKETARQALDRLFFSPKRYDLGRVGRYKINQRLGLNRPANETVLTRGGFRRDHPLPRRAARGPRPHRRHRPSRAIAASARSAS